MAKRKPDTNVSLSPVLPEILDRFVDTMTSCLLEEHFYNIRFYGDANPLALQFLYPPMDLPATEEQCKAEQCYVDTCIALKRISNEGIGVVKRKKKQTQPTLCPKCKDGKYCHYCGRSFDNRGYERTFTWPNSNRTHYICPSCAE